jgi:hypothetical protein
MPDADALEPAEYGAANLFERDQKTQVRPEKRKGRARGEGVLSWRNGESDREELGVNLAASYASGIAPRGPARPPKLVAAWMSITQ